MVEFKQPQGSLLAEERLERRADYRHPILKTPQHGTLHIIVILRTL